MSARLSHSLKGRQTRRDEFLSEMRRLLPWTKLAAKLEPVFTGLRLFGDGRAQLQRLLRVYCLQQWYGVADGALADALQDSQAMRRFAGLDVFEDATPLAEVLPAFCQQLRASHLLTWLDRELTTCVAAKGLRLHLGQIDEAWLGTVTAGTTERLLAPPPMKSLAVVTHGRSANSPGSAGPALGVDAGLALRWPTPEGQDAPGQPWARASSGPADGLREVEFAFKSRTVCVSLVSANGSTWTWAYRIDGCGWWSHPGEFHGSAEAALQSAVSAATARIESFD